MGRSSVFSLEQVYRRQLTKNWTDIFDPFIYVESITEGTSPTNVPAGPAYGYSGGGGAASFGSRETGGTRVERISFANDTATASPRGKLAHDHLECAAFGNTTHGYVMGDVFVTTQRSWVSRVTYASDTSTASPRGQMTVERGGCSSTGNASYAWVQGTYDWMYGTSGPNASIVDRIDFSNDSSTASARGNLDRSITKAGATGNANYGWWAGGNQQTAVSRIDYSNDSTTASPKGTLSDNVNSNTATGNIDYGYNIRGNNGTTIVRYDYASDTGASTPKGQLSARRKELAGATGSQSYGYFMGGKDPSASPSNLQYKTTIDRIDYSNDTATASPKGNLDVNAAGPNDAGYRGAGGFSGQSNAFGGTSTGTPRSIVPATQIENGKLTDKGSDGTFTTQIFPAGPPYGYWGGGSPGNGPGPGLLSLIQRLDYSNDSANAVHRSNMASPDQSRMALSGIASKTHAYWCGGSIPGTSVSHVDRLDLGNDTATAVKKGNLTATNHYAAAAGNESYGYIFGGRPGGTASSRVDRIDYANDSVAATSKGPLSAAFQYHAATGNADYGYSAGGWVPGNPTSAIDRLDYANDSSAATPKGSLSFARYNNSATGNANYGWFGGGNCPAAASPSTLTSAIDRIDYANDTATTSPRGGLNNQRVRTGATGSSSYGYWSGGFNYSKIERVDYANDTGTATNRGNLAAFPSANTGLMDFTTAASGQANGLIPKTVITYIPRVRFIDLAEEGSGGGEGGGGESPTPPGPTGPAFGYQTGGDGYPGTGSRIERIDYSNDTATTSQRGYLNNGGRNIVRHGATGNTTHGYTFGGSGYTNISKVDYANDTAAAPTTAYLATPADYCSSIGNNDYAYTGGRPWSNYYTTGRFDYSNDTTNETILSPSGFGPSPTSYGYGATGNQNYGYFVGGSSSTYVRRIDYSNDTAQVSMRGPLTSNAPYCCATGNADYGWVLVGPSWSNQSGINRIDFANDSATASPRGPLSSSHGYRGSTGSNDYGYFCGGWPSYSTVHRVDFANDTGTQFTKGPLSVPMYRQAGFSAQQYGASSVPAPAPEPSPGPTPSAGAVIAPFQPPFPFPVQNYDIPTTGYGYVAGGDARSYVHRIDYANDTATASLRGNLPTIAEDGGGAGNQSYGYTMGGYDGSNWSGASRVYRVDYANDTATASERGPLTSGRKYVDSIGNNNYGYTDGGYPSSTQSRIDRVDYANDTNTATSLGNIFSPGNRGTDTAGNLNYGYWGGGGGYLPRQSTVTRLDYSNDTAPTSPRGPLTHPSSSNVAVGNANYGYWQISYFPSTRTQLDRVDYANDTATALPKGNLVAAGGYRQTATGNSNYGYFAGGYNYPSYLSTIQRINYLNDTATASPKGPLTNFTYDAQSFSAHENGLSG